MNRTFMEKSRSMLSDVGLSSDYWEEAVEKSCYVVNRSLMLDLVDKTPYEACAGKSPYLAHLKVFGCDAFVHILKERRQKLEIKSEKCICIGYKDEVKGYKMWNPTTRSTVYSRDVIFREVGRTFETEEVREKKPEKVEFNWSE